MIAFATGRILTSGDKVDTSVHYVYGVWDGAPGANTNLVTQILSADTVGSDRVRIVTDNPVDWENDKGWKVALPVAGERVVGERPFYNNGRFYILSTNPTIDGGENWINELQFFTASEPSEPIFDLDRDGVLLGDTGDMTSGGHKPVAKYLGTGIFSQPRLVVSSGYATTLYAAHPDLPVSDGVPSDPDDPGVSGGHFDFDIFYYASEVTSTLTTPNYDDVEIVNNHCKKTNDVSKNLEKVYKGCEENAAAGYTYLTDYTTGAICKPNDDANKVEYYQTLFCNTVTVTEVTETPYKKIKHSHEYDDKYDVTGVNMLNASLIDFNLENAITDPTTPFKILVMNQYVNPAAKLAVGGAEYESVKTYEDLASQTNPATLLAGLPVYTQLDISDFIFNLPLDAFKSKDW
jgi:hypothetical protein